MTEIKKLKSGKYQATWNLATVELPGGHTVTGRPETVLAQTGREGLPSGYGQFVGTKEECEAQL